MHKGSAAIFLLVACTVAACDGAPASIDRHAIGYVGYRWMGMNEWEAEPEVVGSRIRLQIDFRLVSGDISEFAGRLNFDPALLRPVSADDLDCGPGVGCPSGTSSIPDPLSEVEVLLSETSITFSNRSRGGDGAGVVGLIEITFDVLASGVLSARLTDSSGSARDAFLVIRDTASTEFVAVPPVSGRIFYYRHAVEYDRTALLYVTDANAVGSGVPVMEDWGPFLSPAWSPDAQRLAFQRGIQPEINHYDIFSINGDGTGLTNLTDHFSYNGCPVWSPDGARLLFCSSRDSPDGFLDVFVMNADGSNPVNLTRTPNAPEHNAVWSPDGSKIALVGSLGNDEHGIYVVDANGDNPVYLTEGQYAGAPDWSPDGTMIAYSAYVRAWEIFVMDADGSNKVQLTVVPQGTFNANTSPNWSPDGAYIAFHTRDQIWTMRALDGKGMRYRAHGVAPVWMD